MRREEELGREIEDIELRSCRSQMGCREECTLRGCLTPALLYSKIASYLCLTLRGFFFSPAELSSKIFVVHTKIITNFSSQTRP